ncbi:hypothetical protein BD779DRAFT_1672424 [Infundibulicybe gibba]|nr:hypothetical protein BD779DRAFT_1672424 [Infundibulicybe gibba]
MTRSTTVDTNPPAAGRDADTPKPAPVAFSATQFYPNESARRDAPYAVRMREIRLRRMNNFQASDDDFPVAPTTPPPRAKDHEPGRTPRGFCEHMDTDGSEAQEDGATTPTQQTRAPGPQMCEAPKGCAVLVRERPHTPTPTRLDPIHEDTRAAIPWIQRTPVGSISAASQLASLRGRGPRDR